jgi:hypothetical protein
MCQRHKRLDPINVTIFSNVFGFGFHHRTQTKDVSILSRTSVEEEPIKVSQRKPYQGTSCNKLKKTALFFPMTLRSEFTG